MDSWTSLQGALTMLSPTKYAAGAGVYLRKYLSYRLFYRSPILIKLYFLFSSAVSNLAAVTLGKKRASARVTKAEYEALAAFRYSLRQFLSFSESAAASAGITPRQYQALLAIQGFPGRDSATIGELAEQLQIAHHSAVGLVDRLAAQKLIVRVAGAEDRRQVYVTLTARGIEVLDKLASAHKDELRRLGPRLNSIVFALNRPLGI